jgi:ABC-type sugar transport system permease subunit
MQPPSPYLPPPPPPPPPLVAPARPGIPDPARITVGLLIVLPAALALLIGYLIPTVRTAMWSLQQRSPLGDGGNEWVGLDNYERTFAGDFFGPLLYTLVFMVAPLATLLVVGPLLAAAAHHAGRGGRLVVRLGLTVPMVCFAPVAVAVGWRLDRFDFEDVPRMGLLLAAALTTFGLVSALGVTIFLAVLRGSGPGRSAWPAGLAVGGLAAIATLAVALQTFAYPYLITGGGPARTTVTPMMDEFDRSLIRFDFGFGSAHATLLLIPLMLLGIGAALVVIFSGLRFEYDAAAPAPPARPWAVAATVVGLLAVLGITLYGLWPWLTRLGQLSVEYGESRAGTALVNTWLPPLVSTVIGVGLAAVAGFGIGALRPLGRRSELLLLPFAPWLFVGVGPLFLVKYDSAAFGTWERLDTFFGRIPPIWLAVPALFLFTLLFRGLASRPGASLGSALLRSLPMVALVAAGTWLVQSQSLLWGLVVSIDEPNAQVLAFQTLNAFLDPDAVPLGLVLPIPMIVLFALGLGLLHIFYLDRLAIRVGRTG